MPTQDTINRFLELRALGQTLFSISDELKVPISTLGDWNKRHAQHLAHERASNGNTAKTVPASTSKPTSSAWHGASTPANSNSAADLCTK